MFGTTISFKQFLVLGIILYCLFGDPLHTIWKYRRRRHDRYRQKGFLPKSPMMPVVSKLNKLEREFRLDIREVTVLNYNLKIFLKRTLKSKFFNEVNQFDRIHRYYASVFGKAEDFYYDYATIRSHMKYADKQYKELYRGYYSINNKMWESTTQQLHYILYMLKTLDYVADSSFYVIDDLFALQLKMYKFLQDLHFLQEDFRLQHALFHIEKDRVLRQFEGYMKLLSLKEVQLKATFNTNPKDKDSNPNDKQDNT